MNGLFRLRCDGCGAPLVPAGNGDYICEHCDSRYRVEGDRLVIVSAKVKQLGATVHIDQQRFRGIAPDVLDRYLRDVMASQMMDVLRDEIDIEQYESPDGPIYRGSLWVRAREETK